MGLILASREIGCSAFKPWVWNTMCAFMPGVWNTMCPFKPGVWNTMCAFKPGVWNTMWFWWLASSTVKHTVVKIDGSQGLAAIISPYIHLPPESIYINIYIIYIYILLYRQPHGSQSRQCIFYVFWWGPYSGPFFLYFVFQEVQKKNNIRTDSNSHTLLSPTALSLSPSLRVPIQVLVVLYFIVFVWYWFWHLCTFLYILPSLYNIRHFYNGTVHTKYKVQSTLYRVQRYKVQDEKREYMVACVDEKKKNSTKNCCLFFFFFFL